MITAEGLLDARRSAIDKAADDTGQDRDAILLADCRAIVDYLRDNLEVTVPAGGVVVSVTGQVVVLKNVKPITCGVK